MELIEENKTKQLNGASRRASSRTNVPRTFGSITLRCAFRRLQHQGTIVENARGMKDAVDFSIVLSSLGNDIAHLFEIRDIRLSNQQSTRDGSNLKQLSNPLFVGIRLLGVVQSGLPFSLRAAAWNGSRERAEH